MNDKTDQQENGGERTSPFTVGMLRVAVQHKLAIAIATAAGFLVGLIYIAAVPPTYVSEARVYVEPRSPRMISDDQGLMTQSKNYLYTQAELFRSTPILSRAVELPQIATLKTLRHSGDQVGSLKGIVRAQVGERDDIITVTCEARRAEDAAKIANAVVDSYVAYHAATKRTSAGEVLSILEEEKQKRDTELKKQFEALVQFRKTHQTLSFGDDKGNTVLQRLASLSEALTLAQLEVIAARADFESQQASSAPQNASGTLPATEMTMLYAHHRQEQSRLRSVINDLQVRLVTEGARFTQNSPAAEAIKTQIAELQRRLDDSVQCLEEECIGAARQRLDFALARQGSLQKEVLVQQALAQDLSVRAAQYAMLENEVERNRRIYDILDSRIKEIDLTGDTGGLNITVLEHAEAASGPARPRKLAAVLLSTMLGLLVGVTFAMHRTWTHPRLHSGDEAASCVQSPIIGSLQHIRARRAERPQTVRLRPASGAAEAVRALRTAIQFSGAAREQKTLLVTSPANAEGKTVIAGNLAIAMAQTGNRVLLIDANLRKPALHDAFNMPNSAGLAETISRGLPLRDRIQPSDVLNLDVLTAGLPLANPSDLLNSPGLHRVLSDAADLYDWIIVDSPALTSFADARILSGACDATLIVLRGDKTTCRMARGVRECLGSAAGKIIGYVMNDVSAASHWSFVRPVESNVGNAA